MKRRAVVRQKECVACGCCMKVCPVKAVKVIKGIYAYADDKLCIGCGRCMKVCPASVIDMIEVGT